MDNKEARLQKELQRLAGEGYEIELGMLSIYDRFGHKKPTSTLFLEFAILGFIIYLPIFLLFAGIFWHID